MANELSLTRRQREVRDWISTFHRSRGLPPTVRELATALGIAPPTALAHLRRLEEKGFLKRRGGTARGIEVIAHTALADTGQSGGRASRERMQAPFRSHHLLDTDTFIIWCDQLGIRTSKRELEYLDSEGILIPAVGIRPGISALRRIWTRERGQLAERFVSESVLADMTPERIDEQTYYQVNFFRYAHARWLEQASEDGIVDYPAQSAFSGWFKPGLFRATDPEKLQEPYLRFYAQNQCLALRTIQDLLAFKITDLRIVTDEKSWSDLGSRFRSELPSLISKVQNAVLEQYRWMNLVDELADVRVDLARRGEQAYQEGRREGESAREAKLTRASHIARLEQDEIPQALRVLIRRCGYSVDDLVSLHRTLVSSTCDADPNYRWPGYSVRLPEPLLREARDSFALAREFMMRAELIEWALRILGAEPSTTKDLLSGGTQGRYCSVCGTRFRPRNKRHETCGKACSVEHRNKQKREKRRLPQEN